MCIISYQEVFALINDWSVRWFTAMSLRYVCTCTICFLRLPIWGSLKYTAGAFCWINWNWTNQFSRIEDWNTKYSFSTSLCNKIMSLASWTLWLGELIAHIKPCYDYCFLLYIYIEIGYIMWCCVHLCKLCVAMVSILQICSSIICKICASHWYKRHLFQLR